MANLVVLAAELANDPLGRGYSGMSDEAAAISLSTVDRTRSRASLSGREVRAAVDLTEYDALTAAEKDQLISLTSSSDLDPFGFAEHVIKDLFAAGTNTRASLAAARTESVSRATELGIGRVFAGTVAQARAL